MAAPAKCIIGRARTVLVFGPDAAAQAVISGLSARVRRRTRGRRLTVRGPVGLDADAVGHLHDTILPVVDRILESLGRRRHGYNLSLTNLGATAARDLGATISGFSADGAAFLALLSAALRIGLPQNVLATGHLASTNGEIRAVGHLPAKIQAARVEPNVDALVCPGHDADRSLSALSPNEHARNERAFVDAKLDLKIHRVQDVAGLLRAALLDETLVLASLRGNFYAPAACADAEGDPVDGAVRFLTETNEDRFWRVLESQLVADRMDDARRLILARAQYQIKHKCYPADFGRKLHQLRLSLPSHLRRPNGRLLDLPYCLKLGQLGGPEADEDVRLLWDAAAKGRLARGPGTPGQPAPGSGAASDADALVASVLSDISAEALARDIGLPLDSARAGYVIQAVTLDSYHAFVDTIAAFQVCLQRHLAGAGFADASRAHEEGLALLERAFSDDGGLPAAWAEARHGTNGGLRHVLDRMTDRLKMEQQTHRVRRVLTEALDPLDWNARVRFMAAFMERLGTQLPPGVGDQPPARYARHHEELARVYVRSLERVNALFSRL